MNELNKLSDPSELNELNEQTESELVSRTVQSSATHTHTHTHTQKRTARRHPDSLQSATHRFRINEIHGLNVLNQMKTLSELLQ